MLALCPACGLPVDSKMEYRVDREPEWGRTLYIHLGCDWQPSPEALQRAEEKAMAQKVQVLLTDDIDGTEAVETVAFALDGSNYEIDLSEKNAAKLRKAFAPFVEAARKAPKSVPARRSKTGNGQGEYDAKAVRTWARTAGHEVPERGRIPAAVVEEYRKAH